MIYMKDLVVELGLQYVSESGCVAFYKINLPPKSC